MNIVRYQMLCDYLDELQRIKGLEALSEGRKRKLYGDYQTDKNTQWVDIFLPESKEIPVGFLILGYPPNCHPDADFYIEEAYIKPEYRRKGLMSGVVFNYIKTNPGTYCLFILNRNTVAYSFWFSVFAKLGYLPCPLKDVGAGDEYCKQFGFKKK